MKSFALFNIQVPLLEGGRRAFEKFKKNLMRGLRKITNHNRSLRRRNENSNINLVGDPLAEPLNKSFASDLVLTRGDFSECSDSEFSCSVLTERPLKEVIDTTF
jgi:hypothetical protein